MFMPFKVQEIMDRGGIYFGENAISHNLIMCNKANLLNQSSDVYKRQGLYNFYRIAENVGALHKYYYMVRYSMLKTCLLYTSRCV